MKAIRKFTYLTNKSQEEFIYFVDVNSRRFSDVFPLLNLYDEDSSRKDLTDALLKFNQF